MQKRLVMLLLAVALTSLFGCGEGERASKPESAQKAITKAITEEECLRAFLEKGEATEECRRILSLEPEVEKLTPQQQCQPMPPNTSCILIGHTLEVTSVAFSPDGQLLASGSNDGTIKLWEVASGREVYTLKGGIFTPVVSFGVTSLSFSPDSKLLASGTQALIKLWEVATGREVRAFKGHSDWVWSVAFSPEGKLLATGSEGVIKLWDVATGREVHSLSDFSTGSGFFPNTNFPNSIKSVAFSPDGQVLASGSSGGVKLWRASNGNLILDLKGHFRINSIAFTPDGRLLASINEDGTIKLWEVATGREVRTIQAFEYYIQARRGPAEGYSMRAFSVAVSPDGRLLASGSCVRYEGVEECSLGEIGLWDIGTGREVRSISVNTYGALWSFMGGVRSLAFSPDGKLLASSSQDETVRLWYVGDLVLSEEKLEKPSEISYQAQLTSALTELKKAVLDKIDADIESTAQAFTDVKDYWRTKRWADIFTAPLRVLEGTLSLLAKAVDLRSLAESADAALGKSEAVYQVLSTIMMLQDLQEAGEKLHYGLDGPTYIAAVESMLEAADATILPPAGFSREHYKRVIENHLYGTADDTPLVIPRRSATVSKKIEEFARGALQVRSSIAKKFDELIAAIKDRDLSEGFPREKTLEEIKALQMQILKSMSYGVDVVYYAYLKDGLEYKPVQVETKLGAVGELYRAFGQVAGLVAEKASIEARVEVLKLIEAGESAALLYTITYKVPGAEEIRVAQKANVLAEILIKSNEKIFREDAEEKFYLLPQEMMLTLPTELSNLWMIAEDFDQYLRHLLALLH